MDIKKNIMKTWNSQGFFLSELIAHPDGTKVIQIIKNIAL